ncbi:MAG: AAA family ATPase [Ignavibacteria bacterium]|nr:AAA family ATPase [Ignavibacteria bacterium]
MSGSLPNYDRLIRINGIGYVESLIAMVLQELKIRSIHDPRIALSFKLKNSTHWRFRFNYGNWLVLGCEFDGETLADLQIVQAYDKGTLPSDQMFADQPADSDVALDLIEIPEYQANQRAVDSRFQRGLRAAHANYGKWPGSPYKNSHQKQLFADLVSLRFRWIPFMEEVGTRLLDYRGRQNELIELLIGLGIDSGLADKDESGASVPMSEIDPFTVIAALNKFGDEKRSKLLVSFGKSIGVEAPPFNTVSGMPNANARGFWYMPFKPERTADHVAKIWDYFEKVLARSVTSEDLASMISMQWIGAANLTQAMFWLRPTSYLPFDEKTRRALELCGAHIKVPDIKGFTTGYIPMLNQIRNVPEAHPWLFVAWSELGHQITLENGQQELISSLLEVAPTGMPVAPNPDPDMTNSHPLNTILYGPPGTGKSYATRARALEIIDGTVPADTAQQQARYMELVEKGRIRFVTFHQSYAYEEFVEGIRPRVLESGAMSYEVEHGVLRLIAAAATEEWNLARSTQIGDPLQGVDRSKSSFWKCSLGMAGSGVDAHVYPYCLENNVIAIAYGEESIDLSSAKSPADVDRLVTDRAINPAHVIYLKQLIFDIKLGDIVIVPSSINTIRAIGRVTGGYRYDLDAPDGYCHTREVEWLQKDVALPARLIYNGQLTQPALKPLGSKRIVREYERQSGEATPSNYVLIIDEINRGNISNILGELITLIEDDKRSGRPNEIQVQLPYSKELFSLPPNLYVLGTMNTADRSIALVDMALRRRFDFEELVPQPDLLASDLNGIDLQRLLLAINGRLELMVDRDHTIGHAYFINCRTAADVSQVLVRKVIPLLQEYFYDDLKHVAHILNDHRRPFETKIIREVVLSEQSLFGRDLDGIQDSIRYEVPHSISVEQIKGIYE